MKLLRCGSVVLLTLLCLGCAGGVPEREVAEVYFNLGNAHFELGQFDDAVTAYVRAINLDSSLVSASYNLARVYVESNRIEDGLEILEDLLLQDEENSIVLATIGWAYYLDERYEDALRIYQRILERIDDDENALYNAGVLSLHLEKPDAALQYYLSLYEIKPEDELLIQIGSLYLDAGEPDRAAEYFEVYRGKNPKDYEGLMLLARAYALDQYYGKAVELYDEALVVEEADPVAQFEKAEILLINIEDREEGMKLLEGAISSGFADKERITELLNHPLLAEETELITSLEARGLYTGDLPTDEESDAGSGGESVIAPAEPEPPLAP